MIKTVSIILLFILKCLHRIHKHKSIIITVHEKYGSNAVKCVRQYERIKLKNYRLERNTEFLRICLIYNTLPKFIRFKPYNKQFARTHKYQKLGRSMFYDIFKEQQKKLKKLMLDINEYRSRLKNVVSHCIMIGIETYINKLIIKEKEIINTRHRKKLSALKLPANRREFNNKLVYNLSYRSLTEAEENLLAKGWKYAINTKKPNNLNIKADIEYMYYCMDKSSLLKNTDNASKIKALLNEFGNKVKKKIDKEVPNLSSEEVNAITTLLNDDSLVISKVDKGNAIVVMNKSDYLMKAKEILDDRRAFMKINQNLTNKRENDLIKFLLQLKRTNKVSNDEYKLMRPDTGSRTPEAYFLIKVYKVGQPVRPIISSYNSYNYNTAKYLATLLKPAVKKGPSNVKDSFEFAKIIKENRNLSGLMCSLDVSSLYTNVPLDKTIDVVIKKIKIFHPKLTLDDDNLKELFYYCTKKTNFIFNNEHYDQINGVSMGSPVAPILPHLYMSELEENIIN